MRGDTSDVEAKLRGAKKGLDDFGRSADVAGKAHDNHAFAIRRVESVMASYVGHALGANRATEVLSTAISSFAFGGGVVTGVLLGIGAIIAVYEKLTEGTRKAAEEQKKLVEALGSQFQPKTGPRSQTNLEFNAALQQRADLTKRAADLANQADPDIQRSIILRTRAMHELVDVSKQLAAVQQKIDDAYAGSVSTMSTVTTSARDMQAIHDKELANLIRYRQELERLAHMDIVGMMHQFANEAVPPDIQAIHQGLIDTITPNFQMPNIGINDSLTHEQQKTRDQMGILIDDTRSQTETIANAVLQGAGIIVNALNIGGGGRASGIGGALGSVLGTAAGTVAGQNMGSLFGSLIAPGIGTIVGGMAGSLLGGLFDHHKKAIDNNTAALNRVASLLNQPTGYKGSYYTFQAEEGRRMYRQQVETARREVTRGGRTGFALQAGHI